MTANPNLERLERFWKLSELQAAGRGERSTLMKRIHDHTLPAVKVGNSYRIRNSDLHLIAEPVGVPSTDEAPVVDLDDLAAVAAQMVSTWPTLTDDRKRELGRLLGAA